MPTKSKPSTTVKKAAKKTASTKKVVQAKRVTAKKSATKTIVAKSRAKTKVITRKKTPVVTKQKTTSKLQSRAASQKTKLTLCQFEPKQKEQLLSLIREIVDLHRHDQGGLKGLYAVAKILDQYNQQYKKSTEKFDAIVRLGMTRVPEAINEHFFVSVNGREKDVEHLYELLNLIAKGKVDYPHAKEQMIHIYKEVPVVHHSMSIK